MPMPRPGFCCAEGAAQLRQFVQRLADVGVALLEEGLAADRGDRNRRFEVRTANARAGDEHVLTAGALGALVGAGIERAGAGLRLLGRALIRGGIGVLRIGRTGKGHGEAKQGARTEQTKLLHF